MTSWIHGNRNNYSPLFLNVVYGTGQTSLSYRTSAKIKCSISPDSGLCSGRRIAIFTSFYSFTRSSTTFASPHLRAFTKGTGYSFTGSFCSGLALTREMLQTLKAQLEFFEQMRSTAAEMGVDFDADAVAEAARNITAADEPEGRNRKERRWFGKKKK